MTSRVHPSLSMPSHAMDKFEPSGNMLGSILMFFLGKTKTLLSIETTHFSETRRKKKG